MDCNPNSSVPTPSDRAPEAAEELVTISRRELDTLLARVAGQGALQSPPENPPPVDPADGGVGLTAPTGDSAPRSDYDGRIAELERQCKAAVRDRELASALAGRQLVAGAARQLIKLWRDELDVYEEQGDYKVVSRDGRSVAQAVADWLSGPEYTHFCLPTSRGGAGAREATRPAAARPAEGPTNLGEAIVMRWREESASRSNALLKPIGLRRGRSV